MTHPKTPEFSMCRHLLPLSMALSLVLACALSRQAVPAPSPAAPEVPQELLKARLETARKGLEAAQGEHKAGRGRLEAVFFWTQRVVEAELALSDKKADRIAAHEKLVKLAKDIEETAKAHFDVGQASHQELLDAAYRRIEAEIELARAKAK